MFYYVSQLFHWYTRTLENHWFTNHFCRVFGSCVLPFVGWLWGDWFITSLIGVASMASLFFAYPLVTESPRWLLSQKGRTVEAKMLLNKIAKKNSRPEPANLYKRLNDINDIILNEPKYGVISLFSRSGMVIKTMLLLVIFLCGCNIWWSTMHDQFFFK